MCKQSSLCMCWPQLYYTPDHLDLCVDVSYDDLVSMDTQGVKPDNIFKILDEWLPEGQSSYRASM